MSESPRAVPFVTVSKGGEFVVTDEAAKILQGIKAPLSVACVVGPHRSGKSFLLNRVLLDQPNGFEVGPTVQACTKGLWIWSEPVPAKGPDGKPISLLVMDSEGLGAVDSSADGDTRILSLALLLSSVMIYNSVGVIDEYALQDLSLLAQMTKHVKVESAAHGVEETGERFSEVFPSLLWVVRDFALSLGTSTGGQISPSQYLENCLENAPGFSVESEEVNRVRRVIKGFFPERDCCMLRRPVEDEGLLQKLCDLGEEELREDFVADVRKLRDKVISTARAKHALGVVLDGALLVGIAREYVSKINHGCVPVIESALARVMRARAEAAVESGLAYFAEGGRKIKERLPVGAAAMEKECAMLCDGARKALLDSGGDERDVANLSQRLESLRRALIDDNSRVAKEGAEKELGRLYAPVERAVLKGEYEGYDNYEVARKGVVKGFLDAWPEGTWRHEALVAFLEDAVPRAASTIDSMVKRRMKEAQGRASAGVAGAGTGERTRDELQKALRDALSQADERSASLAASAIKAKNARAGQKQAEESLRVVKSDLEKAREGQREAEDRAKRAELELETARASQRLAEASLKAVRLELERKRAGQEEGDGGVTAPRVAVEQATKGLEAELGALKAAHKVYGESLVHTEEERDAALKERGAIEKERDAALKERDAIEKERDAALKERDAALKDRDAIEKERDAALKERDAIEKERHVVLSERDAALKETNAAEKERDAALQVREILLSDKEASLLERDHLASERDAALKERDAALKERDAALKERDAAEEEKEAALQVREMLRSNHGPSLLEEDSLARERYAAVTERDADAEPQGETVTVNLTQLMTGRAPTPDQRGAENKSHSLLELEIQQLKSELATAHLDLTLARGGVTSPSRGACQGDQELEHELSLVRERCSAAEQAFAQSGVAVKSHLEGLYTVIQSEREERELLAKKEEVQRRGLEERIADLLVRLEGGGVAVGGRGPGSVEMK